MISAQALLLHTAETALLELYGISGIPITFQKTRKEFEGDFTLVTFPFVKPSKKSPEEVGRELGEYFVKHNTNVSGYNVIKGFLNVVLSDYFWIQFFNSAYDNKEIGTMPADSSGRTIMLEYSSPNTNKPLHLGHVRNNLLGVSVSRILEANGHRVIRANLVNDRGIHICKSMLAWKKWANGETPASSGMKGDHLVGKYYVMFEKALKEQLKPILAEIESGHGMEFFNEAQRKELTAQLEGRKKHSELLTTKMTEALSAVKAVNWPERAEQSVNALLAGNGKAKDVVKSMEDAEKLPADVQAALKSLKSLASLESKIDEASSAINEIVRLKCPLMQEAGQMLRDWESGNSEVRTLWSTMNGWVYDGFSITYRDLGVSFDKTYYESDTYVLGKELVEQGLKKGVFYRKDNGSVAIDLTADGLDEKIVLRSDGTSVYITQDLGTAIERFKEFPSLSQLIYTVGNEQDYHFKVLFLILQKLGYAWAKECYHLSYGMVELPHGKMKSREGTVVDADDLIQEMVATAEDTTRTLGKVEGFSEEELKDLYWTVGMGALKYFILKVDPRKKMLFDPKESVDFNGHTGPFIQYTHARIKSVLRKSTDDLKDETPEVPLHAAEKELIRMIYDFEENVREAGNSYSPALIANYTYELTKLYNRFYHELTILKEEDTDLRKFRLRLSDVSARVISTGMGLLGIRVPEKM